MDDTVTDFVVYSPDRLVFSTLDKALTFFKMFLDDIVDFDWRKHIIFNDEFINKFQKRTLLEK